MPRETIHTAGGRGSHAGTVAHVAWGRSTDPEDAPEHLQLGVTLSVEQTTETLGEILSGVDLPDEQRTAVIEQMVRYLGSVEHGVGFWADFDRASVNRLIRILRKARDQAYGADA